MLGNKVIPAIWFRNIYRSISTYIMANSKFEYVRDYETDDRLLPNAWIVVRVDGKGFHKFSKSHCFEKPNDETALNLMSHAAINVMEEFLDVVLAYGQSDEYSFVFHKSTNVYNRRMSKILSYVTSIFTSGYLFHWNKWFPDKSLRYPPSFDGRIIMYPSDENLKDYLKWRQADVHINNLYNTTFWNLVQRDGKTNNEAEAFLRGTFSSDKNEILFSRFGINYNNELAMFRKGTILLRKKVILPLNNGEKLKTLIVPYNVDMIKDDFWREHPEVLDKNAKSSKTFNKCDDINAYHELIKKQLKRLNYID